MISAARNLAVKFTIQRCSRSAWNSAREWTTEVARACQLRRWWRWPKLLHPMPCVSACASSTLARLTLVSVRSRWDAQSWVFLIHFSSVIYENMILHLLTSDSKLVYFVLPQNLWFLAQLFHPTVASDVFAAGKNCRFDWFIRWGDLAWNQIYRLPSEFLSLLFIYFFNLNWL